MNRMFRIVLLATAFAAGPARGQDFSIYTQNLLHFGQGSHGPAKCQALADAVAAGVDIILVQELMTQAYPCPALPNGFQWQSYGPYGTASYREYYGYLWRTGPTRFGTQVQALLGAEQYAPANAFMRPPVAVQFRVTRANSPAVRNVWLVNFHAVWGRTVGGRRAEAGAMGNFYTALRQQAAIPVIVGGDWNLRAANARGAVDPGFNWLGAAGASILPNDPTTLTAGGRPSSAYDHYVYTSAIPGQSVALGNVTINPSQNLLYWRQNVSDHRGVAAEVTFR
jgi:endonuclease/exonuclease/phosphatase family metal-dependent hydrolase